MSLVFWQIVKVIKIYKYSYEFSIFYFCAVSFHFDILKL